MTEILQSTHDSRFEDSIPKAVASLGSILSSEELQRRPSRPPDYERENSALVALVSALADSPGTILQRLTETILEITRSDSAGVSLLTTDDGGGGQRFYWPALAGMWTQYVRGGLPRDFVPCGHVLDRNCALLFTQVAELYPILQPVIPRAEQLLCVPFYVGGRAVGTIWAVTHNDRRQFDAEDERVMGSLGKFASSAYQAVMSIDDLKFQVAERETAEDSVPELARGLEAKIRRLVEANVVGIVLWNSEGAIMFANEAFLHMVQYASEDIAAGTLRWTDLTPAEWRDSDERALAALKASGTFLPFEKEYFRKDGSRVPVLLGGTLFERGGDEGVAFVLDLTDQKRALQRWSEAQETLQITQAELARVSRLTVMGELAASIAHEVNQPLTAVTNNASGCLRLLGNDHLEPDVLRRALEEIVADSSRASAVIARIRSFIKKTPSEQSECDINDLIQEVIAVTRRELHRNRVAPQLEFTRPLPLVRADRVQLQQVLLNLIMNGIEAMTPVTDRPRVLWLQSQVDDSGEVIVSVRDSGTGLRMDAERLFTPFVTTKADGMGMGLSISRSLIEAHGGRLWAGPNDPDGAVFSFTLPPTSKQPS